MKKEGTGRGDHVERALRANRKTWDEWTRLHQASSFYDVPGFIEGKSSLRHVELAELGPVGGNKLLHLQCHFGLDTLSLARLGARVTGLDFSGEAVRVAQELADGLGIHARFIRSDVYDVPRELEGRFDVVYTSYGVLSWLHDLGAWASVIARCLKPGGFFYMVEFHPFAGMLDEGTGRKLAHPYFHDPNPLRSTGAGSYAVPSAPDRYECYEWQHGLADVVNAIIKSGLRLDFLHEFPFSTYGCWPFLEQTGPERWRIRGLSGDLPLMFSLRATLRGAGSSG